MGSPGDDVLVNFIVPFMQKNGVASTEDVWLEGCRRFSVDKPSPEDADSCDASAHFICQRKAAAKTSKKFSVAT